MRYNCIIIDDEQPARRLLENYCNKLKEIQIIGSFKSAIDALPYLKDQTIHILFLDIQMPDISGIDFLKSLNLNITKVVFTTAYRNYAIEGFELNATDYLLKPIEFHRFLKSVEKIKHNTNTNSNKSVLIRSGKKQYKILESEILYIKSESEYVKYVTKNTKNILVHGALKDVAELFRYNANFIRIHRSYIININYVTYIEGTRVFINDEFFPISETYRQVFFDKWKKL